MLKPPFAPCVAAPQTRGRKKFMEDRHVVAALDPCQGVQQAPGAVGLQEKVSVAAVFDGHAGYATAAYAAQHIPNLLHEALSGRAGNRSEGELPDLEVTAVGIAPAAHASAQVARSNRTACTVKRMLTAPGCASPLISSVAAGRARSRSI